MNDSAEHRAVEDVWLLWEAITRSTGSWLGNPLVLIIQVIHQLRVQPPSTPTPASDHR